MGNQNNVFIVKVHQLFQRVQELAPHLIPCPEGIIRFMGNAHLLVHIKPTMLIQIFQKINNNRLEGVILLFQFRNSIFEHFPCQRSFRLPALDTHIILNVDIGRIYELDIAVRIQHQRIREIISKGGLATKRYTVNPDHTLCNRINSSSLVFR